jgi:uncharacterized protein
MGDPEIFPPLQPLPPAAPAPEPRYTVFRGPNGIRAGWRIGIFLVLVAAIGALFVLPFVLMYAVKGIGAPNGGKPVSMLTPQLVGTSDGVLFLVSVLAAMIMARIERRKFGQYGLPRQSAFGKDFWIGAVAGFLAISAALLGIFMLHGFRLNGLAIHGGTIVSSLAIWAVTFMLVGLAEEFSFRGYLQYTLTTGMGFWPSAIVLSLLFGAVHATNSGETKSGLASVVLFGLLFCLFLRRTGNLWWAVGFHAGWDWGQTFFYGVPDSGLTPYHNLFNSSFNGSAWLTGGSVGPEASVMTPIVLAIVAILFASVYRENRYEAGV